MEPLVIELFAGVGGFRVGLNNITEYDAEGKAIENGDYKFVWTNQWEPSTKTQHAYECYLKRFGSESVSNEDISLVDKSSIPNHSLLCGGFPCQDYSVAHSLTKEKGIEGKKGILWWQIRDILQIKKTPFVLLENVDRLLKSPAKQRGRDFGIMLRCMADLGYIVEWRVINAAEYGFPQKRRRIFIFAYHKTTQYAKKTVKDTPIDVILRTGFFAKVFPIAGTEGEVGTESLVNKTDLVEISDKFSFNFENSGVLINGIVSTVRTIPRTKPPIILKNVIEKKVDSSYYLDKHKLNQFEILRGPKKKLRYTPDGTPYNYSEGAMSPYDELSLPGRTMLTSEGSVNRSTHIIRDPGTNQIRILTPVECERLNMFPDNWTNTGMPESRRYFMMGNALVCGIISKMSGEIHQIIDDEPLSIDKYYESRCRESGNYYLDYPLPEDIIPVSPGYSKQMETEIRNMCSSIAHKYVGKKVIDIAQLLGIPIKNPDKLNKSIIEKILAELFKQENSVYSNINIFDTGRIVCRSFTLSYTNGRKEDTKFFSVDFEEMLEYQIEFEESEIYEYFKSNLFLFAMLKEPSKESKFSDRVFLGFKMVSFDDEFIYRHVLSCWKDFRDTVSKDDLKTTKVLDNQGNPIINKSGLPKVSTNFPKSEDHIVFFRGSGQNSTDRKMILPDVVDYPQYIWIKGSYLVDYLSKKDYL